MTLALLVLVLALVWVAITDGFTLVNLVFGLAIASVAVLVLRHDFARPRVLHRVEAIVRLTALFVVELFVSAVRVAVIVLTPNIGRTLHPGIIAFPLTVQSNAEITLLASLITLTPGTLSVDVSEDRRLLFIHVLNLDDRDALIASIANGFEKRVREVYA